ncbi:hypothetical protein GQ55_7G217000 [Panicum hallii var. hallii]|uniref:Uncharacterized protein n=1 Tax=Panicum hallii var. hallii TaxID=1504633 RepID=A0A2T7CXN9_9POAL|nr:hypothetical protein GQ55_7G217000 [Panicum hallii var. hallii]
MGVLLSWHERTNRERKGEDEGEPRLEANSGNYCSEAIAAAAGGFPFPVSAEQQAAAPGSGEFHSNRARLLPSTSDSFCVCKLLNRHTTSAFGGEARVREGHIRLTGAAGPPLFRLASPRSSHWSAQSWVAPFKEANCTPPPPPPSPPSTPPHHTIQRTPGGGGGRRSRIEPAGARVLRWGSLPAAAREQKVDRIWAGFLEHWAPNSSRLCENAVEPVASF